MVTCNFMLYVIAGIGLSMTWKGANMHHQTWKNTVAVLKYADPELAQAILATKRGKLPSLQAIGKDFSEEGLKIFQEANRRSELIGTAYFFGGLLLMILMVIIDIAASQG